MTVKLIKFTMFLSLLFGLVVFGNVFIGDLSVPVETVTETVIIDAN